jgi:serine/threonine protein kinase
VLGIAVGVSIGGAAAVAAGVLLLFFMRRKKKRGVKIEDAMKTLDSDDDRFNIPYGELAFKRELGAGSFGKVFLGTWRKAEVALKLATLSTWEDFANEVKLTVNMPPHPNVVQVFGISRDGPHPVLILEFCDGGSLDKMLYDDNYSLSTEQTLEIVTGIARGMYHLHRNSIIHRDLAARNILLASGRPKISDFGLARVVDKQSQSGQTKSNIGPLRWMAPESLQSSTYSTQSDVWSFGIVVYEIVARHEPHFDEDPMSIGFRIRDEGLVPTIPETCDPFIRDLMLACWHPEPAKRPTFDQICELIKSKQAGDTGVKFVPSVTPSTGSSNESTLTAYSSMPASTHTVN